MCQGTASPHPTQQRGNCLGVARGAVSDLVPGLQGGVTQALESSKVGSALAHAPFPRAAGRCETGAALRGLEIEARVDVAQQSAASPASCVTQSNARSVPALPCRKLLWSNWKGLTRQMAAAMKAPKTRGAERSYLSIGEITQKWNKAYAILFSCYSAAQMGQLIFAALALV